MGAAPWNRGPGAAAPPTPGAGPVGAPDEPRLAAGRRGTRPWWPGTRRARWGRGTSRA